MKVTHSLLASALFLITVGCASGSMDSGAGSSSDRAAIQAQFNAWQEAANRGAWDEVAAIYADDAMFMAPNSGAARGRAEIRGAIEGLGALSPRDVRLTANELEICGDTAYEVGTYSMSLQPPGAQRMNDTGKYVVIYKRQSNGSWLMWRDIFNTDMPMP